MGDGIHGNVSNPGHRGIVDPRNLTLPELGTRPSIECLHEEHARQVQGVRRLVDRDRRVEHRQAGSRRQLANCFTGQIVHFGDLLDRPSRGVDAFEKGVRGRVDDRWSPDARRQRAHRRRLRQRGRGGHGLGRPVRDDDRKSREREDRGQRSGAADAPVPRGSRIASHFSAFRRRPSRQDPGTPIERKRSLHRCTIPRMRGHTTARPTLRSPR